MGNDVQWDDDDDDKAHDVMVSELVVVVAP